MSKTRGLVQVYTGDGKGKTTAAWGQALRAAGRDMRAAVVRFLKSPDSGEAKAVRCLFPMLSVFGETSAYDPHVDQRNSPRVREETERNFELARQLILSGDYDVVVLDEINVALHYGHVSESQMMDLLRGRPHHTEIVLTGRNAPAWLIAEADLVTEMVEVKHPMKRGIKARKGIEY